MAQRFRVGAQEFIDENGGGYPHSTKGDATIKFQKCTSNVSCFQLLARGVPVPYNLKTAEEPRS